MKHRRVEGWASQFRLSGWEPAASHDARAPLAPPTLAGALGSAMEDMRRHDTCAPAAMAGSAAHAMVMGDGRAIGEGASGTGDWDGRVARPTMGCSMVGGRSTDG